MLGFAEESADEADIGGLHLGASNEIGESLPEGFALFGVFEEADLLKDSEEVSFEVFEVLGCGEILVGFGVSFWGCWIVSGEFIESEGDGLGKIERGVLGGGGDGEKEMATGKFAIGKAAAFPAKDKSDVLLGLGQLGGKTRQGNESGKAVSRPGGGADDEVGLGNGVFKGAEAKCLAQDGLGMSGGSLSGRILEVAWVDEAEIGNAKVVHGASDGANVFREGRFHQNDAKISREVWHWLGRFCASWLGREWSGRGDLNSRPRGPDPRALPDYATPRQSAYGKGKIAARKRRLQRRFFRRCLFAAVASGKKLDLCGLLGR